MRAHESHFAAKLQTFITPSLLGQIKRVNYHFEAIEIIFHMQLESASNSFWLERYSTLNTTLAQCVLYLIDEFPMHLPCVHSNLAISGSFKVSNQPTLISNTKTRVIAHI